MILVISLISLKCFSVFFIKWHNSEVPEMICYRFRQVKSAIFLAEIEIFEIRALYLKVLFLCKMCFHNNVFLYKWTQLCYPSVVFQCFGLISWFAGMNSVTVNSARSISTNTFRTLFVCFRLTTKTNICFSFVFLS